MSSLDVQCHSQGQPLKNPINGKYYNWPVGFQVGLDLKDFWKLEEHKLGEQTFTHFADGTAHKNRMQGNDFVQSANSMGMFNGTSLLGGLVLLRQPTPLPRRLLVYSDSGAYTGHQAP